MDIPSKPTHDTSKRTNLLWKALLTILLSKYYLFQEQAFYAKCESWEVFNFIAMSTLRAAPLEALFYPFWEKN